jgi:Fe-S cluster assembly protein SufD
VGTFNGKVVVRAGAVKTDAKQLNRSLLLSQTATAHTQPQLEIFADDVKCAHGATIGQLDDEALFFLRSRGIGIEEARRCLTMAFASDVLAEIKDIGVRDYLQQQSNAWLATAHVAEGA